MVSNGKGSSDFDRLESYLKHFRQALSDIRSQLAGGITLTVHHTHDAAITAALDTIKQQGAIMAGELAKLTQEVSEARTVMASAKALLVGLKAALDEAIASGDPAALTALSDSLDTGGNDLAAAILDNTPTPPVPTVIALPAGTMGQPYSGALPAIAGAAPFSHAVTAGALPDGLTLDATSGALLGTPERVGSFAFSASSVDASSVATLRSFSIEIV